MSLPPTLTGRELQVSGGFVDPNIPAGFAPFNVQNINGKLYVTYAKQDDDQTRRCRRAG